jgi:nucleoside-diphosphate-sugar epimerase
VTKETMNWGYKKSMESKIACVTGASGLIGKEMVKELIAQGKEVRVLSRKPLEPQQGIRLFQGDLLNVKILKEFLFEADHLFHCAGEIQRQEKMKSTNVDGTKCLFGVARKTHLKYFCHISSAGVVGKTDQKWVTEETVCNPQNEYERTKYEAEKIVSQKIPNCSTVILRPINVIDDENLGVGTLPMRNSLKDKIHTIIKGGECAHLVHAKHVVECAVFFMNQTLEKPEVFFVGLDEDELNTIRGIWNLYHSKTGNEKSKLNWNMPVWFPYLIRKSRGLKSNPGHTRYSSKKITSYGFDNHQWDMNRITENWVGK